MKKSNGLFLPWLLTRFLLVATLVAFSSIWLYVYTRSRGLVSELAFIEPHLMAMMLFLAGNFVAVLVIESLIEDRAAKEENV